MTFNIHHSISSALDRLFETVLCMDNFVFFDISQKVGIPINSSLFNLQAVEPCMSIQCPPQNSCGCTRCGRSDGCKAIIDGERQRSGLHHYTTMSLTTIYEKSFTTIWENTTTKQISNCSGIPCLLPRAVTPACIFFLAT